MAEVRSCSLLDLHCRGYSGGCKAILIFPGPTVRVQFAVVRQAPYFNNFSLFLPPRKSSQSHFPSIFVARERARRFLKCFQSYSKRTADVGGNYRGG